MSSFNSQMRDYENLMEERYLDDDYDCYRCRCGNEVGEEDELCEECMGEDDD
jgi:hypothetical protein